MTALDGPLVTIDPFDPAILLDPYPYFARLRAEAPVFRDPKTGIVFVSTHAAVIEVDRQPLVFSNGFGAQLRQGAGAPDPEEVAILQRGWIVPDTLLTADPPVHTRFRKLAGKAFTFKRVETMAGYIAAVAHALIDGFADQGRCEFKSAFANRLPMTVIADALGVPREDMPTFHRWSEAFVVQLGRVADRAARLEAARLIVEFKRYFADVIERKRRAPTDDIISDLVHADLAEEGDARKMELSELLSILQQFLVAGNETTAHALAAGLYYLIRDADLRGRLAADATLVPAFVEETLRFLSPTNNMWRVATRDAEIAGVPVGKNQLILLRYGCANRDAAQFPDPEQFDIDRPNGRAHLAFGAGIHTCIAAPLARKELSVAFPILIERLRNVRLRPGADIVYEPNILLRGVKSLPIEFDAV